MSSHLAIGAVAALATVAALSRRTGSAAALTLDQAGVSPDRKKELHDLALAYRERLESNDSWGGASADFDYYASLFAEREQGERGYQIEYLGRGRDRSVFRVKEGALKVDHHKNIEKFNLDEAEFYRRAPHQLKKYLLPVIDVADDGSWVLMEFAERVGGHLPNRVERAFRKCGIRDLSKWENITADGRAIDYSYSLSDDTRERCLRGEIDLDEVLYAPPEVPAIFPAGWRVPQGDAETVTPPPRGSRSNLQGMGRKEYEEIAKEYRFRVDHNTAEHTIAVRAYSRKQKGKLVGSVGVLRSYGVDDCQAQVRSLIGRLKGRLPDKAERRVPMVVMSTIEAEHRGRGLGVLLYKVALQAWFDAYGPSLVAPNMCSSGRSATSTAAMRVWSSLCRELPCEHPVVAVVEPVPGLDGVDVKTVKKHKYMD